jgi:hypothetical protein
VKITLWNTDKMVVLNGVQTRVWEGKTESGIPVHAFIVRVAAPIGTDDQFAAELEETRAPSAEVAAYPARMVL